MRLHQDQNFGLTQSPDVAGELPDLIRSEGSGPYVVARTVQMSFDVEEADG